jgi:hypothetical protein
MIRRLFVVSLLVLPGAAAAQDPNDAPKKLLLTPAKPPAPLLQFPLLPELRQQHPGNAAPLYVKAGALLNKLPADAAERDIVHGWLAYWGRAPLSELPREEVRTVLQRFAVPLDLLDQASRCEQCDFGIAQRIRESGFGANLPEIQQMRMAATVLCARARLELADDRPDKALRTLASVYQLAQRTGEEPCLICGLVGIAIATIANNTLEQVLTHPKTPNLYWTLSSLPPSLIDLRRCYQGERMAVYGNFPGMLAVATDPEAGPLPEEKVRKLVPTALALLQQQDNLAARLLLAVQIQGKHEAAKKALIAVGRSAAKVEQWPHLQVAFMHALLEYDHQLDNAIKWQSVPLWQAPMDTRPRHGPLRVARMLLAADAPAVPLAAYALPAVEKVRLAQARLDRHFAALRCVEAIRLYAANHQGQLPATLADITEVAVPVCAITGKSFDYRRTGTDSAILSAPAVPKERGFTPKLVYELVVRPLQGRLAP